MSQYETNLAIDPSGFAPAGGLRRIAETLGAQAANLLNTLLDWQERVRSRQHLAGLDDYMLRDIGVDRAAAAAESDKVLAPSRNVPSVQS
jgi:uncharacterized protein YjiS (DUF1127 family)